MAHFDVAIVGLGALGSAAAYHAVLKGAKVVAFEQFELGHIHGSSHDTSRIVRTSYNAPEYVALAKAAYKDWADLEKDAGYKLLHVTGGVIFFGKDASVQSSDYASSLDANNVPYELLDATEVIKRWPQFDTKDVVDAIYTADTGIVHAARSVATMQNLARAHGAILKEHTRVDRVRPQASNKGVTIETSQGQFHASKVILATDAWTNKLLEPLDSSIPLSVSQEQVTYYKPKNTAAFEMSKFPVWIYFDNESFYGFPTFGEPTIKCARDSSQNFMTPDQRSYVHSPRLLEQLTSFIDGLIPDGDRQTLRTVTCQYTTTIDRNFIISPLEKHPNIIVALGAAQAFKFAPAIGRVLAELAIDGRTREDISKWSLPKAVIPSKL
ncbi:FAD dependent oxidoreductase [Pyrenochaeta sp. MPI-SDFR-AT-0127]|nr:FAD dependent oxidoreductase [Pyrenochaeta sp. MPI-SDFR-AT-0127]